MADYREAAAELPEHRSRHLSRVCPGVVFGTVLRTPGDRTARERLRDLRKIGKGRAHRVTETLRLFESRLERAQQPCIRDEAAVHLPVACYEPRAHPVPGEPKGGDFTAVSSGGSTENAGKFRILQNYAASCTVSAIMRASRRTFASSLPSTMTRSTGSVPDGRSSTRPSLPRARSASRFAFATAGCFCQSKPLATRTLTSSCGKSASPRHNFGSVVALARIAESTCKAETMPSPVVCLSRQMMCPEFSPPSCQSFSWSISST